MNSIQPGSIKIKKGPRIDPNIPRNFICGGCGWSYLSYPALSCHIRRKHNGIKPVGTIIYKSLQRSSPKSHKGGRPNKPENDLDEVCDKQLLLEDAQNEFASFLAEKIIVTGNMGPKSSLESIVEKIQEIDSSYTDKWLTDLKEGSKIFVYEYKEKDQIMEHLDFEDDFKRLDPKKSLDMIVWFMICVAKVYVKLEFIPEVCLILSRIWKVLDQSQLNAQDLDNKLIWKKGMQESENLMTSLPTFKNDKGILKQFIQKACQLIGKAFDDDDDDDSNLES